jgi:hypothetical protein
LAFTSGVLQLLDAGLPTARQCGKRPGKWRLAALNQAAAVRNSACGSAKSFVLRGGITRSESLAADHGQTSRETEDFESNFQHFNI